jgi:DNA invertase Pin-like site-specific DNA recombinase
MKRAVIYIRVSSKQQVDGRSLEVQEETCRRWCQAHDAEVAEIFREEGE